jgi:transglutaminase-like putative cysteine protease
VGAVGLSAARATAPVAQTPASPLALAGRPRELRPHPLAAVAFAALALLAGMRFASLLSAPPLARVLAISACAALCGLAVSATGGLRARPALARSARLAALALGGYVALRAAGAPAHLLWPWRWSGLAREISRGLGQLDGLWPYRGAHHDVRLAVLLALPVAITAAAALVFWPGPRAALRRGAGTALLIVLYAIGAANAPRSGWRVQGLLLLGLLALWAWSWRERRSTEVGRATLWLLVAAIGALALAGLLRSSRPLIAYERWNPFATPVRETRFEWNQTYGPLSWSRSRETMVDVATTTPHLWRATTLDRFDGVRFLRSNAPPPDTSGVPSPTPAHWLTRTTVTVRGFGARQLLTPGAALAVSVSGASVPRLNAIAGDGSITTSGAPAASGDRYTVTAYVPQPSTRELREASPRYPSAYRPFTELELPGASTRSGAVSALDAAGIAAIAASPYAPVYELARRIAAHARGPYATALAIESFLARGFSYDERPRPHPYPLVSFLLHERLGYCQQFSGAMTLMLRMDGVPARVGTGFLPGARVGATRQLQVSARDAHAWVEVFFPHLGWVTFDPTPPKPLANLLGAPITGAFARAGSTGGSTGGASGASPLNRLAVRSAARRRTSGDADWVLDVALGSLALAALAALLWARSRVGGEGRGRLRAHGRRDALVELANALERIHLSPPASTTLLELEAQLSRSHGDAAARYVRLLRNARYAPPGAGAAGTAERRAARRALGRGRGALTRLVLLAALPPWSRVR